MALEESVDMNQYLTREIKRLAEALMWSKKDNEILIAENEELKKQLEDMNRHLVLKEAGFTFVPKEEAMEKLTARQVKEMMAHGISD